MAACFPSEHIPGANEGAAAEAPSVAAPQDSRNDGKVSEKAEQEERQPPAKKPRTTKKKGGAKKAATETGGTEGDAGDDGVEEGAGFQWTDNGIECLIEHWGAHYRKLDGNNLSLRHWERISQNISLLSDCHVNASQCQYKVDSLKRRHKTIKEKKSQTGAAGKEGKPWKWFDSVDAIIHGRAKSAGVPGAVDDGVEKVYARKVQINSDDEEDFEKPVSGGASKEDLAADASADGTATPNSGKPKASKVAGNAVENRKSDASSAIERNEREQKKSGSSEAGQDIKKDLSNLPGVSGQPVNHSKLPGGRKSGTSPIKELVGVMGQFTAVFAESERSRAEDARLRAAAEDKRHALSLEMEQNRLNFQQQVALMQMQHQNRMEEIAAQNAAHRTAAASQQTPPAHPVNFSASQLNQAAPPPGASDVGGAHDGKTA